MAIPLFVLVAEAAGAVGLGVSVETELEVAFVALVPVDETVFVALGVVLSVVLTVVPPESVVDEGGAEVLVLLTDSGADDDMVEGESGSDGAGLKKFHRT